jgi:hypothetical protein
MNNHNTLIKLAEFEVLKQGWCYGEGVLIEKPIIKLAEKLFYNLFEQGVAKTDAFPGLDGEVRITGYEGLHYLEFTIENDGSITYLYELDDQEQDYLEGLSLSDAITKARETISSIKSCQLLLDPYIKNIGTPKSGAFKVLLSDLPVMEGFQSFATNALFKPAHASASTQQHITKASPTIPRSIGYSINPYSQIITKSSKPQVLLEMSATGISWA